MPQTPFGKRLAAYGKWKDKTNMDRFVILVFLTAEEKRQFVKEHCDPVTDCENTVYIDGQEWILTPKNASKPE